MTQKWEAAPFKNPLARALGLGSNKHGFHHWWLQRVTAVSNLFLMLWAIWAVLHLIGADFDTLRLWFQQPVHAILLSLFIISTFLHASMGLQVVIEDYVHCEITKVISLMALKLVCFGLAVAAIFSILKLSM